MTRRLTIDDATEFVFPARLDGRRGVLIVRGRPASWLATWRTANSLSVWDLATAPTAQDALDAAIAAGAVIDEGDET